MGYLAPEFELLGVPFEGRNERSDDAIRALRASFGRTQPEYDGTHYHFKGMVIDPCGIQTDIALWIGGQTRRSLRRAVEFGDAWCPFSLTPDQIATWLKEATTTHAWQERDKPLDVAVSSQVDPLGAPNQAAAKVRELLDAGVTALTLRFVQDSLSHYLEQLEAMVSVVATL